MRKGRQAEQKRTAIKKLRFLSAFRGKADGNISDACKAVRVGRTTFYEWLKADVKFAAEVDDANEAIIDWAESRLRARMRANDTTAIIFFLKTKAKKRGYVERVEQEQVGEARYRVVYEKQNEGEICRP